MKDLKDTKVPELLRSYFEKSGGGYKEYVLLQLQISTIFLFLGALLSSFLGSFYLNPALYAIMAALALFNIHALATKVERGERTIYAYFFGSLTVLSVALAVSGSFVQRFSVIYVLAFLVLFAFLLIIFKVAFSRAFAVGEVLAASEDWAAVHMHYDLATGVKNGFYAVRVSKGKYKKGDRVRVRVISYWGDVRPWEIIEKA
jgi:uncharacterized membrane protein